MDDNHITTITVSRGTLDRIKALKEHERIPNEVILVRLLDHWQRYKSVIDQQ